MDPWRRQVFVGQGVVPTAVGASVLLTVEVLNDFLGEKGQPRS